MNALARVVFHLLGMAWVSAYLFNSFVGWEWFDGAGDRTTLIVGMLFMIWSEVLGKKDA